MTEEQPLLGTDSDTYDGETGYDIGFRHAKEGHEFFWDRLPRKQRRDYARGYARGAMEVERERGAEGR